MFLPLFTSRIKAGFPSPADGLVEESLDIDNYLIDNPISTFLVRVSGDSMSGDGIISGDILVVDKSKKNSNNKIIVAILNGEFTIKRLVGKKLIASNKNFPEIEVKFEDDFEIWGEVIGLIRKF